MPSGRTHDRVTLWTLPIVAGVTFGQTRSSQITLFISTGYLLGGLILGPDLDIYSRHFQRWGFFKYLWLPYQQSLAHRSFLSHGPIIGTLVRVLYLTTWMAIIGVLVISIGQMWGAKWDLSLFLDHIGRSLFVYKLELLSVFIGLELGAMSHYVADWGNSTYKQVKKKGLVALIPQPKKRPKRRRKSIKKPKPYQSIGVQQKKTRSTMKNKY